MVTDTFDLISKLMAYWEKKNLLKQVSGAVLSYFARVCLVPSSLLFYLKSCVGSHLSTAALNLVSLSLSVPSFNRVSCRIVEC